MEKQQKKIFNEKPSLISFSRSEIKPEPTEFGEVIDFLKPIKKNTIQI